MKKFPDGHINIGGVGVPSPGLPPGAGRGGRVPEAPAGAGGGGAAAATQDAVLGLGRWALGRAAMARAGQQQGHTLPPTWPTYHIEHEHGQHGRRGMGYPTRQAGHRRRRGTVAAAWQGEQGRSGSKARGRQAAGWRLGVHPWARAGDGPTEVRGQRRAAAIRKNVRRHVRDRLCCRPYSTPLDPLLGLLPGRRSTCAWCPGG